ncbi:tRNA glutamyl-Q(34) synthetase GluQRS [Sulfuriroseicoccus oceanibius]|uniref:tRNA glutamyl-Q(34) synthetase GluQRS n=1 Tax=Sulfuriroseicoccus oceanibius TaxID=2707525 RepID=A0A6B3L589_9BACT|nr:tRNA glutamyl-Q(34) synthetase GluQRS [Sulfuriroseicoccus oceanibius]QQL44804.1 tRNA glutamyl-Q(34) synthetase GluQRS [Sulfuriroseicoccus oceanibius]
MSEVTRFAPSPTGWLHLGHAYAAIFAHERARRVGGRFFLRMEDIDASRVRPEYYDAVYEDLRWLGLDWDEEVTPQLQRMDAYRDALAQLDALGVLYPCFCTRREIREEIAAMPSAPHGPDGAHYPGTCRQLSADDRAARMAVTAEDLVSWRLDMAKAVDLAGELRWVDRARGEQVARPEMFGDVILARKDAGTSYHLSVVVDDAAQGVTLVTRGEDLFESTHIHRLLQQLLGLPVPEWEHHRLICDESGKRLAKRDDARSIRSLREAGMSAEDVRGKLGL